MSVDPSAGGGTLKRSVTIVNQKGLHARAAAAFAKTSGRFKAEISVSKDGITVSGLSIMGLMMLAASPGTEIEIAASGEQAAAALQALVTLVEEKFGED